MSDLGGREASRGRSRSRDTASGVDGRKKKKAELSVPFLHRCCIQFSPEFTPKNYSEELASHREFVARFADEHSQEIVRAIVWRVLASSGGHDLLGAWRLLTSMYDLARTEILVEVALLSLLDAFLLPLISSKWFTTKLTAPSLQGDDDPLGRIKQKIGITQSRVTNRAGSIVVSSAGPQISAAAATREPAAAAYPDGGGSSSDSKALQEAFNDLANEWLEILRVDLASSIRRLIRRVYEHGNFVEPRMEKYFIIKHIFYDSLYKLRRKFPRPQHCRDVAVMFGWNFAASTDQFTNPLGLPNVGDVEALSPMHPIAKQWLTKLAQSGCCFNCDTWRHDAQHCPCVLGFQALLPLPPREGAPPQRRRPVGPQLMPYGDAVAKLNRYGVSLPLTNESIAKALDAVVQLIGKEMPYEELLRALDAVRGYSSTAKERHALWIISNYNLLPSLAAFGTIGDNQETITINKADVYLVDKMRRLRDYYQLSDAVEVISSFYRDMCLPLVAHDVLVKIRTWAEDEEVKQYPFVFCFTDGTEGMEAFTAEECTPNAAGLAILAPYMHCLCRHCLEPFHKAESCEKWKQPWDLRMAQRVLDDNGISRGSRGDDVASRIDIALARLDILDITDAAKELRKAQIMLSVQLLLHNKMPYCVACAVYGHGKGRCETHLHRSLAAVGLTENEVRLDPGQLEEAIKRAPETARRGLEDAMAAYCAGGKAYPPRYADAVTRLQEAKLSIATARYSPEAMEQFLRFTNAVHLIPAAETCMELKFPEVCLFCDSLKHRTQDCSDIDSDGRDFLKELDGKGISLMEFSVSTLCPEKLRKTAIDSGNYALQAISRNPSAVGKMPTKYEEGRVKILKYIKTQCVDRYARGGTKRRQWEGVQSAIENLRQAEIPLHVAKYNPVGTKRFLDATRRSELKDSIDALAQLPTVCFYCGNISHAHADCERRIRGAKQQFFALLRRSGIALENFVRWAIDQSITDDTDSGSNQILDLHLPLEEEQALMDARSDAIKFARHEYGDALESRGLLFEKWRQSEEERQHRSGATNTMTIGRTFSLLVETSADEQHQLIPDPEHLSLAQEGLRQDPDDVVVEGRRKRAREGPHYSNLDAPAQQQPRPDFSSGVALADDVNASERVPEDSIAFDDVINLVNPERETERK